MVFGLRNRPVDRGHIHQPAQQPFATRSGSHLPVLLTAAAAAGVAAVQQPGVSIHWTNASGTIWVVYEVSLSAIPTLYAGGALIVSSTPLLLGCLAWTRAFRRFEGGFEHLDTSRVRSARTT